MGKEELREDRTLVTLVINVHELSILLLVKDACGSLESPWLFSISFVDSQVWFPFLGFFTQFILRKPVSTLS